MPPTPVENQAPDSNKEEKARPEPTKVKNAPQAEVVKVKKIKKGPKKIVRKEKIFVR